MQFHKLYIFNKEFLILFAERFFYYRATIHNCCKTVTCISTCVSQPSDYIVAYLVQATNFFHQTKIFVLQEICVKNPPINTFLLPILTQRKDTVFLNQRLKKKFHQQKSRFSLCLYFDTSHNTTFFSIVPLISLER